MDYKKYSLENLEKWIEDAINSSEASPQEIFDVIKNVVTDNYYCYKNHTARCYELLTLLNGNGKDHITFSGDWSAKNYTIDPYGNEVKVCDKDDKFPDYQKAWKDFWEENYYPEEHQQYSEEELNAMCDKAASEQDKVVKWQLPVEVDGLSGECYVNLPDDLLEAANIKENDLVEWIDHKDGSFELRKVNGTK